eukprot:7954777-Ditylum_brightwellii.AAC.1
MNQRFQDMHEEKFDYFTNCMKTLSSTVISNEESLQKTESKIDKMSCNISKFNYRLNKEEKIYIDQQKDIKQYITEVEKHA